MPLDPKIAEAAPDDATAALFERLAAIEAPRRFFRALDGAHLACFVEGNRTLAVTFEETPEILRQGEGAMPLGATLAESYGWSFLSVLSTGQTWFRSEPLYALFDDLIDNGLFDAFDRVIFYGAGAAGHAACAFSVAAPGATVIAVRPHATQNPDFAAFDARHPDARHLDFTSRYGYAPRLVEGAEAVHLFYDPGQTEDTAHAAQFNQPHVQHHRVRRFGPRPEAMLAAMDGIEGVFELFETGSLDRTGIQRVLRARRDTRPYINGLISILADRPQLLALVCHNFGERHNAPRYQRRYAQLVQEFEARGERPLYRPAPPAPESAPAAAGGEA